MKLSKRRKANEAKAPQDKQTIAQAVETLKGFDQTKFNQTVELVMHLGIDPRQVDQALRGSVSLPNGIGKTKKVIAFCEGNEAEEAAKAAGAIEAGAEDLVKKISDGWMDFDVAVAHPAMMRHVSKLGRVLGPSGKMPSPKAGTVTPDVAKAVTEFVAGKVNYRNDEGGNLHVPVGKMDFDSAKLVENIEYFVSYVKKLRPSTAKGTYIKKVVLSGTMTPGVELEIA